MSALAFIADSAKTRNLPTLFDCTSTHSLLTSVGPSFVFLRFAVLCTGPILVATEMASLPVFDVDVDAPIPGPNVIDWEVEGSTGSAGRGMASPGSTKVVMSRIDLNRQSSRQLYICSIVFV
jgi:hypothetical protein